MANIHRVNRLGAMTPRLANRVQQNGLFRWLLENTTGIDRRRSLPILHDETLRVWMVRRGRRNRSARPDVLLLDDCFTNFNEPHVGQAAVRVLEAAGCSVHLPAWPVAGGRSLARAAWRSAPAHSGPGAASGGTGRGRRADSGPRTELPADAVRRMARVGPRSRDSGGRQGCPPRRRLVGWRIGRRPSFAPLAQLAGALRGPRPLPPESARRRRGYGVAVAMHPGVGSARARHRLLRHGRLIRLRKGRTTTSASPSRNSTCCPRWRRTRRRWWSPQARRAGTRSRT